MWWREGGASGVARLTVVVAAAALLAGCFQPLYGERSLTGNPTVRDSLSSVSVAQIAALDGTYEARLAVQIRNDLLFNFTGGGEPRPQTHRLQVQMTGGRTIVMLDANTALPSAESYGLNASYSLTEIATGKIVLKGSAVSTVSYDPPGAQRFARIAALGDAERRAAKVISENITTRLASYFNSGT